MNREFTIIDRIKCYAPESALDNSGYHPDALTTLAQLEEKNFWYQSRNEIIIKLFKKHIGENPISFLEVGCGNGTVLRALSDFKNLSLTGADIYLSGVKFAQSQLPNVKFIQMDATDIPFKNEFDAIGCFDVLEHIGEDIRVIHELGKALKQNGYLFITVPQYPFLWSKIDEIDRHKRRYRKKEISEKIKNAGLDILYINSFMFSLFPLMAVSRLFRKRKQNQYASGTTGKGENNPEYPEINMPDYLNHLFRLLMKIDEWLIEKNVKLPFGGSIMVVAKKR